MREGRRLLSYPILSYPILSYFNSLVAKFRIGSLWMVLIMFLGSIAILGGEVRDAIAGKVPFYAEEMENERMITKKIDIEEVADAGSPSSGKVRIYYSSGRLKRKDSGGVEKVLAYCPVGSSEIEDDSIDWEDISDSMELDDTTTIDMGTNSGVDAQAAETGRCFTLCIPYASSVCSCPLLFTCPSGWTSVDEWCELSSEDESHRYTFCRACCQ